MFELALPHFALNLAYAKRLVADLSEEQFVAQPVDGRTLNHPAFIIGHLAFVCDVGATLLGLPAVLPTWRETLGNTGTPLPDRSAYPSNAELVGALETAHTRLVEAARAAKPEVLNAPPPERFLARFPTVAAVMLHMLTNHQSVHLGQLSAWRRACGLPAV